jgi:hypothetical protein
LLRLLLRSRLGLLRMLRPLFSCRPLRLIRTLRPRRLLRLLLLGRLLSPLGRSLLLWSLGLFSPRSPRSMLLAALLLRIGTLPLLVVLCVGGNYRA